VEFQKKKDAREAEVLAQRIREAEERERETAKLRAMQERATDK
jgi:hypothetical protein